MAETPRPTETPDAPPPRGRRWTRWLLAGSLALNVLVICGIAGALLKDGDMRHRPAPRDVGFAPFIDAMGPEHARMFREDFRRQAPPRGEARATMHAAFQDVMSALRAEPFDRQALEQALRVQQERLRASQGLGQSLMLDRVAAMTPEERAAFADRMEALIRRPGKERPPK